MAEQLTPQQALAVNNRGGRLLVSAAAGSGKTKVLVDRLLSYILDPTDPANIDDFLIITYTKAAASELRGKIADKISERISQSPSNRHLQRQMQRLYLAKISTVHAYCADILREYAHILDISGNFRVAEESECLELQMKAMEDVLEEAYRSMEQDEAFCAFIETLGVGRNDARVPQLIFDVYCRAMCHLSPSEWMDECLANYELTGIKDVADTIWGRYLMEDIKEYLQLQCEALSKCADKARFVSGFEKVAALLDATVDQVRMLMNCTSWDQFVTHMNIDYGTLSFPRKCQDPDLAAGIKAVRNACKKGIEKRLRRFSANSGQAFLELADSKCVIEGMLKLVRNFSVRYAELKSSRNILDFTDLEHKTLDLLLGKKRYGRTMAAQEIGRRFREVMVDEYQDSNAVQDAIYSALTEDRSNCFMVGDVKQSIYQFRLADPSIFLSKYNQFPNAEDAAAGEGRRVMLSRNFRSSGGVIDAVNDVFSMCMSPEVGGLYYGDDERLYEGIPHIPLNQPEVELYGVDVQEDTYLEEAEFVSQRVQSLLNRGECVREGDALRPAKPSDIVILLRSPGSVGGQFKRALENRGIRCSIGNQSDLLQAEEVQVLVSILQIVSNPLQDIPLISALTSRVFCFTADDIARVRCGQRWGNFFNSLKKCDDEKVQDFLVTLNKLRKCARTGSLVMLVEEVFLLTGIENIYGAMADGQLRRDNLQSFYQVVSNFVAAGQGDLDAFLNHLVAMKDRGLISGEEAATDDSVKIMSIHKSKGLEFPVVILAGLSKDFNQEDVRGQVLCDRSLGIGISNTDSISRVRYPTISKNAVARKMIADSVSEELRVLYVAMTRARDRLIMTFAARKLQEHLEDVQLRLRYSNARLLSMEATSAGDWVIMTALAGEAETERANLYPWKLDVVHVSVDDTCEQDIEAEIAVKADLPLDEICAGLNYKYPHMLATNAPSKQTATQIKGRFKDREVAEHTRAPFALDFNWRKPTFAGEEKRSNEIGRAVHTIMQHINFRNCGDLFGVQSEIKHLTGCGYVPEEMQACIDAERIYHFFQTDIGRKLIHAQNVLREFKFSLLVDADEYHEGLVNEKILLQGVVDCALIQEDGITVIDFKTDHVTDDTLNDRVRGYTAQITAYAHALEKIYELPVMAKLLYFFELSKIVEI